MTSNCGECNVKFTANILRISCEKCKIVYHKKCIKVSNEAWNKLVNGEHLYNCDKCKNKRRSSVLGNKSFAPTNKDETESPEDLLGFKACVEKFQSVVEDLEKSLSFLHGTVDDMNKKVSLIMSRFKDIDTVLADNTRLRVDLDELKKRMSALESQKPVKGSFSKATKPTPSFTVSVTGVDAAENELSNKMSSLFTELEVNYGEAVDKCVRALSKDKSKSVVFLSMKSREHSEHLDKLVKAAKTKKPANIFINEKLNPACYKLLKGARVLRQHGFKHVWSNGGRVLARKEDNGSVSLIRNSNDIEVLKNEPAAN